MRYRHFSWSRGAGIVNGQVGPIHYRFGGERSGAWIYLPKSNHNGILIGYVSRSEERRPDEGFLFRRRFR